MPDISDNESDLHGILERNASYVSDHWLKPEDSPYFNDATTYDNKTRTFYFYPNWATYWTKEEKTYEIFIRINDTSWNSESGVFSFFVTVKNETIDYGDTICTY